MGKSQMQRTNSKVLLINSLLSLFLIVGYIVELIKGLRTPVYVILFTVLVIIPITVAFIVYKRNKESSRIKYITLIGYFIAYLFVMFSTDRTLVYVYLFPIILMYFLYFDIKLMVTSCSVVFITNLVRIVLSIVNGHNEASLITDYTIQFASVVLFSVSLVLATKLSNTYNEENVNSTKIEKDKQEAILKDVLKIASILDSNSKEVYRIVGELASSTETVNTSVGEIAMGISNTAENIQNQSEMTGTIQDIIINTSDLSKKMDDLSQQSSDALSKGVELVNVLNSKASVVNENSENAYSTVLSLKEKSDEIRDIINIITGITEQTNLLALNAAIESARAGESGRGFAVVAEEVRKLAGQSKDSTTSIENIIYELQEKSDNAAEAVNTLKAANIEQSEIIQKTKSVFDNVIKKVQELNDNINQVNKRIGEIVTSNDKIVDSIAQISAAVEQATASAQEASAMSEVNIPQAGTAKKLVEELMRTSKEMDKYINTVD